MNAPTRVEPPPGRRPDASMSLLIEAASNPVDPGYAEAAARRSHHHAAGRITWRTRLAVGILAAVLGLATVWAVRELRAPEPDALRARTLLEEEIERRTASADALGERNAAVRAEIDALSAEALEGSKDVVARLTLQGAVAGTVAVQGPGLRVTLTDSARAASGDPDAADERVQDLDLQIVSNGLWAAGAEAIAINGQRLTALSAIRSAGEAILVDLTPLAAPYVVAAIGDPDAMQVALARTAAARHLQLLRETYGIGARVEQAEDLLLPAIPVPTLRSATPSSDSGLAAGPSPVPGSGLDQGETT